MCITRTEISDANESSLGGGARSLVSPSPPRKRNSVNTSSIYCGGVRSAILSVAITKPEERAWCVMYNKLSKEARLLLLYQHKVTFQWGRETAAGPAHEPQKLACGY